MTEVVKHVQRTLFAHLSNSIGALRTSIQRRCISLHYFIHNVIY